MEVKFQVPDSSPSILKKAGPLIKVIISLVSLLAAISLGFYFGYRYAFIARLPVTNFPDLEKFNSIQLEIKGTLEAVDGNNLIIDNNGTKLKFVSDYEVTIVKAPAQIEVYKDSELRKKLTLNKLVMLSIQLKEGKLKTTNITYDFKVNPLSDRQQEVNSQPSATDSAKINPPTRPQGIFPNQKP